MSAFWLSPYVRSWRKSAGASRPELLKLNPVEQHRQLQRAGEYDQDGHQADQHRFVARSHDAASPCEHNSTAKPAFCLQGLGATASGTGPKLRFWRTPA